MSSIGSIQVSEQLRMLREGISAERPSSDIQKVGEEAGTVSFGEFLSEHIRAANESGLESERALQKATLGEEMNPHATLIAMQKASISLTLMMGIKERLERAFQEIIKTPLG
jgi:flagellar hook-basal body complex protein FliE